MFVMNSQDVKCEIWIYNIVKWEVIICGVIYCIDFLIYIMFFGN